MKDNPAIGAGQLRNSAASIPAPLRLPRHPIVVALARQTGRDRHQAAGLLLELTSWANDQLIDLAATPVAGEMLAEVVGADFEFWRDVAAVGWLKLAESAPDESAQEKNAGPVYFDEDQCRELAGRFFRRCDYNGSDGRIFWQLAALVIAGRIRERVVVDALEGAKACKAANPPAYVRRILGESIGLEEIKSLLASVRRCPSTCNSPPAHCPLPVAFALKTVEPSRPRAREDVLAELAAAEVGQ